MVGKKEIKNKWFIALKPNKGDIFNTDNLTQLDSPPGRYYADPFIFKKDDVNYLFFEDTDYKKGVISCCIIDKNGEISQPKVVLSQPYHLSFPCIFQDGDDIYMVPETGQRGTIEIYKSSEFPNKWEPYRLLLQGLETADPVMFKHDGVWFLICTAKTGKPIQYQGIPQEEVDFDNGVLILILDYHLYI